MIREKTPPHNTAQHMQLLEHKHYNKAITEAAEKQTASNQWKREREKTHVNRLNGPCHVYVDRMWIFLIFLPIDVRYHTRFCFLLEMLWIWNFIDSVQQPEEPTRRRPTVVGKASAVPCKTRGGVHSTHRIEPRRSLCFIASARPFERSTPPERRISINTQHSDTADRWMAFGAPRTTPNIRAN